LVRQVTSRHVRRIEPVDLVVSSRAVQQTRHSQNAWARHVERVESWRDKPSGILAFYEDVMLQGAMTSFTMPTQPSIPPGSVN